MVNPILICGILTVLSLLATIISEAKMSKLPPANPQCYQITLEGHLDKRWADWFDGFSIRYQHSNGDITILTGPVADQAALRGMLNQIWDFNLSLIAVERLNQRESAQQLRGSS